MSDIQIAHVRHLDMTQLLVFSALMRSRKLTLVAQEIGLTQSAISHVLKRLRDTFGDELFLRRPAGLEPTARALALEPLVNQILDLSTRALQIDKAFDPLTEKRVVRISGSDAQMALYSPLIIALFAKQAPGLRLSFTNQARDIALDGLNQGKIDIGLGYFWKLPDQFEQLKLISENYQVVFRRGHALENAAIDLDTYCKASHLLVSINGDMNGIVDSALRTLGKERNVAASVGQFFPALATVSETNLVTTIPTRLARRYCEQFGLIHRDVPFPIRSFDVSAIWHKRNSADTALRWVREQLLGMLV
jgi:DNA-binding transcriptional LysR family regulator